MVNDVKNGTFRHNKESGVVLIVSLVFLVALTAVAAALMQNTTTDMKMSGASEEKVVADQEVVSAIDEFVFNEVTGGGGNNIFAQPVATFQGGAIDIKADLVNTNKQGDIDTALLDLANNQFQRELPCPRSRTPSSSSVGCNILRIQISKKYGRHKTSTVEVNSGIVQEVIK
jgi:hypothetical protein